MTLDKLPHTLTSSLKKEGEHLLVTMGIAQPRSKVFLVDALLLSHPPPLLIERGRKVDTPELRQRIEADGNQYQQEGHHQQHPVLQSYKQRQQQAPDGIEQQNVTTPDEHQMQEADANQNEHSADKKSAPMTSQYQ